MPGVRPSSFKTDRHNEPSLESEGRRRVLKLMAATAALGGSACSEPPKEEILPYVRMPERTVPGHPVFYASTLCRNGHGLGVLVETNMGRPTKIEGNPQHPASVGATDVYAQAAILQLWDPDRSSTVLREGEIATWNALQEAIRSRLPALKNGAGLKILTKPVSSPTLSALIHETMKQFPAASWHSYDAAGNDASNGVTDEIYSPGSPGNSGVGLEYVLSDVEFLLTLDADLFSNGPGSVRHARDFMQGRGETAGRKELVAVEATPGLCGAMADERLAMHPSDIHAFTHQLAAVLGVIPPAVEQPADPRVQKIADRLQTSRGRSLVVAGRSLDRTAQRLVWLINHYLGNIGTSVKARATLAPTRPLSELIDTMQAGDVDTLLMIDVNPAYDCPQAAGFEQALSKVPCSVHMGLYRDETAEVANWHVPLCHDLEDWGDAVAPDGTASVIQPVIAPLYGGRSPMVLLGLLNAAQSLDAYTHVRTYWQQALSVAEETFEQRWQDALGAGVIAHDFAPPLQPVATPKPSTPEFFSGGVGNRISSHARQRASDGSPSDTALAAIFVNDSSVDAGGFSNSAWLQELPRPFTSLTWDNAALLAPATAQSLSIQTGDIVALKSAASDQELLAPIFVLPEHAEGCVSLPLGYGRTAGGSIAPGIGFNARLLQMQSPDDLLWVVRVSVRPTGLKHQLALTQADHRQHGREIARHIGQDTELDDSFPAESLYPAYDYSDYAWGMSVDLDVCVGCNACVLACQAENNIPTVGREEVARGRAMHWLRIDYYRDEGANDQVFQPMACQHCENAPCEVVCPVGATMHDSEGLNVQVYNRCVGTRFCSNNCPYKVRRFNFFEYQTHRPADSARRNPEVTVRQRGVMEKCTYCVQRISRARIEAQKEGRRIHDGEVVTACQAVCPTSAIVFGDLNDPDSLINQRKASSRNYHVLNELNTRPRTSYLARVERLDILGDGHG